MVELLSRIFIKNHKDVKNPAVRRAYGVMVSIIGILMNLLLAVGKLLTGLFSGSVSICADAVNNFSDAGSSLISLICFRISAKPADRKHPFGHARMEYVTSMFVSFLILLIGAELLRDSVLTLYQSIVHPAEAVAASFPWLPVCVLSASILGKIFLALLNLRVGKKIDSAMMRANMTDSIADVASTSAVLTATVVAHYVDLPFSLDGAMGILVSAFILFAGAKILKETQNSILGAPPSEETVSTIEKTVNAHSDILGLHDLIVHEYGSGVVIASFHVEVDGSADIFAVHDTIDNIERELWESKRIRATIHLDPVAVGDPTTDAWRAMVIDAVKSIDERISVHDFRAVRGVTHSNLVFDIAAPFEVKMSDAELIAKIEEAVRQKDESLFVVITVDRV